MSEIERKFNRLADLIRTELVRKGIKVKPFPLESKYQGKTLRFSMSIQGKSLDKIDYEFNEIAARFLPVVPDIHELSFVEMKLPSNTEAFLVTCHGVSIRVIREWYHNLFHISCKVCET